MKSLMLYVSIVTVTVMLLLSSPFARADSTTAILNKIIQGTPGVTNVSIGTGVRVGAAGAVDVAAGGLVIPVATSVTADVGFGAIAAGGAKVALRALPWVGAAITVAEIANAVKKNGVVTCPPPDFFCKGTAIPGTGTTPGDVVQFFQVTTETAIGDRYPDPAVACNSYVGNRSKVPQANGDQIGYTFDNVGAAPTFYCNYHSNAGTGQKSGINYSQNNFTLAPAITYFCSATNAYVAAASSCVIPNVDTTKLVPVPDSDLQTQLNNQFAADASLALKMKQQMDAIAQANPGLAPPVDVTTAPLTVTAPQVVSPPKVVSTTQLQNPDGSTSTQVVSNQTTVTPSVSTPGTASNPTFSYPSTTTSTTTTTNNTTNVSNQTTTTTINNAAPASKPADAPTDYSREATQKSVLQQLDGSLIPAAPDDQGVRVKTETLKSDQSLADTFNGIPKLFVSDKASWFSWVWAPPVGVCSASDYSGSVHGYAVSFNICPWVSKIRDAIGFLFALIGALSIYSNIFKKGE